MILSGRRIEILWRRSATRLGHLFKLLLKLLKAAPQLLRVLQLLRQLLSIRARRVACRLKPISDPLKHVGQFVVSVGNPAEFLRRIADLAPPIGSNGTTESVRKRPHL